MAATAPPYLFKRTILGPSPVKVVDGPIGSKQRSVIIRLLCEQQMETQFVCLLSYFVCMLEFISAKISTFVFYSHSFAIIFITFQFSF
jgi:hypothetical protein